MKRAVLEFLEDVSFDCKSRGDKGCWWYAKGQTTFVTIQSDDDKEMVVKDHCENDEILTLPRSKVCIVWSKNHALA